MLLVNKEMNCYLGMDISCVHHDNLTNEEQRTFSKMINLGCALTVFSIGMCCRL